MSLTNWRSTQSLWPTNCDTIIISMLVMCIVNSLLCIMCIIIISISSSSSSSSNGYNRPIGGQARAAAPAPGRAIVESK